MKIVLLDGTEREYVQTKAIMQHIHNLCDVQKNQLEIITLREKRISHCTKCLVCTNKKGIDPVKCFLEDGMDEVIDKIEQADAYIILTDRNSIFKKNKLFSKFSSRLVAYYYRPNKNEAPRRRRPNTHKNALIINYNLANFFTNFSYALAKRRIKKSAKDMGANVVDSLLITPANTTSEQFRIYEQNIVKSLHSLQY